MPQEMRPLTSRELCCCSDLLQAPSLHGPLGTSRLSPGLTVGFPAPLWPNPRGRASDSPWDLWQGAPLGEGEGLRKQISKEGSPEGDTSAQEWS